MALIRGLVALQLIGLLVSSMYCNGQGNKLIFLHAPAPAPVPVPVPAKAPPPPPLKLGAAVEGVVFCMSCKLPGYEPSLNASPLRGAIATVVCNRSRRVSTHGNAATDSHGYFLIQVQNRRPSALRTCSVVLKVPVWCNKPVYPKSPKGGVPLKFERVDRDGSSQFVLFTAGFLEFAPANRLLCPRQP